jgi:hypothetical protein
MLLELQAEWMVMPLIRAAQFRMMPLSAGDATC